MAVDYNIAKGGAEQTLVTRLIQIGEVDVLIDVAHRTVLWLLCAVEVEPWGDILLLSISPLLFVVAIADQVI